MRYGPGGMGVLPTELLSRRGRSPPHGQLRGRGQVSPVPYPSGNAPGLWVWLLGQDKHPLRLRDCFLSLPGKSK